MKSYNTILLAILLVPGLSQCEGCEGEGDLSDAICKSAQSEHAAARQSYNAASAAYSDAIEAGESEQTLSGLKSDMDAKFAAMYDAGEAVMTFCN